MCDLGLSDSVGSQGCIVPGAGAVAVAFSPVALRSFQFLLNAVQPPKQVTYVPSGGTIVRLGRIVISLTVSPKEEYLVLHISRRFAIQSLDFLVKSLPLGFSMCFALARVSAVYEAEVFLVLDTI